MSVRVEVRCPHSFGRLFLILRQTETPVPVSDNCMELACSDCRRRITKQEGRPVHLVVHCYNLVGEFVKTRVTYTDE